VRSGVRQLQKERADNRERDDSAKEVLGRVPPWPARLVEPADRRLVKAADRRLVEAAGRRQVQVLGQPPELPALPARGSAA